MARKIKTEFAKALKIEGILEVAKLKGVFVVPLNGGNKIRVYYNGKNPVSEITEIGSRSVGKLDRIRNKINELKLSDMPTDEKTCQYQLANSLNNDCTSEYKCLCTEYAIPDHYRKKNAICCGRQDLVIIDKRGNVLILECKYQNKSLANIKKHEEDFNRIKNEIISEVRDDLKCLLKSQKELGIYLDTDWCGEKINKIECAFLFIDVNPKKKPKIYPRYDMREDDCIRENDCYKFKEILAEAFSKM